MEPLPAAVPDPHIQALINEKLKKAEDLGEQGMVDEARKALEEAEALRKLPARKEPIHDSSKYTEADVRICRMENGESRQSDSIDRIINVYSDFMMRVTKFEELVSVGSKLLVGFQQALGFLRRPPIDKASALVESIIKAHGSRRVLSYVEAGCVNSHDGAENVIKSKVVVSELDRLLDDAASLVQTAKGKEEDMKYSLDSHITSSDDEEEVPEVTDYAMMMAVIYSMVKRDYTMQVRVVSCLNPKSLSGQMDTYCQMWSLRPFVDDDVMREAWKLVP